MLNAIQRYRIHLSQMQEVGELSLFNRFYYDELPYEHSRVGRTLGTNHTQ